VRGEQRASIPAEIEVPQGDEIRAVLLPHEEQRRSGGGKIIIMVSVGVGRLLTSDRLDPENGGKVCAR
jgi:hypothetical protein